MKFSLLLCIAVFLFSDILQAQNVNDDSAQYTPIPIPIIKEKKNKINEQYDSSAANRKVRYFFSLQSGTLIGCRKCSKATGITSTSSMLNGITIGKKIRAGIGLGFDSYTGWQTLPAYLSFTYDLFGNKNRNAFFLQMNYGVSKAWRQNLYPGDPVQRAYGGRMFAPLAGYRIKYHQLNLSFTIGAKLQRVFSYYEYPTWTFVNGEYRNATIKSTVKQDMSRLMIAIAVGL